MAGYTELIKNFEKIRGFTRDFFIYGFKGRNDFSNISPRSYDNERRRIESYLSNHIIKNRDNRGKTISISSNSTAKSSNPLFKLWQTKSFTKNDVFLHFVILDILSAGDSLCVNEIAEIISSDYTVELNKDEIIDIMTIRNKLNEYTKEGILEAKKQGKTLYYSMHQSKLNNLNTLTRDRLFTALSYYKNLLPAGFIGHSINNTSDSPFIYKQIFFSQILDDEVLLQLLKAILEKRIITLSIISQRNTRATKVKFLPIRVVSNTKTGRRYISVYSIGKRKFTTIRLDHIMSVEIGSRFDDFDSVKNEYIQKTQSTFSLVHQTTEHLHSLRMLLSINEETEQFVLERINREGKHGIVSRVDENLFEYKIEITDTVELVPWLRTFIGRIVEIEGSEKHVITQFKRDIKAMASMYFDDDQAVE